MLCDLERADPIADGIGAPDHLDAVLCRRADRTPSPKKAILDMASMLKQIADADRWWDWRDAHSVNGRRALATGALL